MASRILYQYKGHFCSILNNGSRAQCASFSQTPRNYLPSYLASALLRRRNPQTQHFSCITTNKSPVNSLSEDQCPFENSVLLTISKRGLLQRGDRRDIIRLYSSQHGPDTDNRSVVHSVLPTSSTEPIFTKEIPNFPDPGVSRLTPEEQFSDHVTAYGSKTTWELARTVVFFFLFRFQVLTDKSQQIMEWMRKLMGKRLSEFILKKMIYDQFVAGETTEEIQRVISKLQKQGIGPLIAVPIEDDVENGESNPLVKDERLDSNLRKILDCIDLCCVVSPSRPMFQLKMTSLMSPELTKSLSTVCSDSQGSNPCSLSSQAVVALTQGMKGLALDVPKTPEWETFYAINKDDLDKVFRRFQEINKKVLQTDTVAMVDAEYTYLNPALRHLTFAMKEVCNHQKPLVFYTYQAYLRNTLGYLLSDLEFAKNKNLCFGAKLVRGAYIFKEQRLAQVGGYPDPINESYEATSESYRRCLDKLLEASTGNEDRTRFIIASHNEDSIRYALGRMHELGLSPTSKSILFGQLYGMADHVSYTLGSSGYSVVKSLPYGSVEETIPYLSRRAQENRSIFDNVRKEKTLVKNALRDRLTGRSAVATS